MSRKRHARVSDTEAAKILHQVAAPYVEDSRPDICPYCRAGHRRHTSKAPGHWHTIVVRCWDQDKR